MSGWDAPTGHWDPGDEPEGSGSPDQGYQQTQPTGAHRATRGEGVLRAGRRGLPGYDQAESHDQPGAYDQPGGYADPQDTPASQGPPVPRRAIGSGSGSAEPYDQGSTGAYPSYGAQEASPMAWSGVDDQGYGTQGFGQQDPGAGQDYATQAYGRPDLGPNAQGYQNEAAYPQQGFEPSGYAQGGHADQGYGPSEYGQNGYGQASDPGGAGTGYQQEGYGPGAYDAYGQNGAQGSYPPAGYGQGGYGQGGYSPDAYRQDAYGQGGYGQGGYGQPGLERPGGPAYGDEDLNASGTAPRATPPRSGQRPPQRPGRVRMVLYLGASVLGVVLIVLLVVHLTKSGPNPAAGSTTSPTASAPAGAAGSGFVFTSAAKAGTLPLNAAATRDYTKVAEAEAAPIAQAIKSRGAGQPGKELVAMYDLSPVTSDQSPNFKAVGFVGWDGTFDSAAVIRYMKTHLKSTRMVNPGPHGGKMMCGYNTSTGTRASECVWVTPSTFGLVQFIVGQAQAKYPGASRIALEVRNAVEVKS